MTPTENHLHTMYAEGKLVPATLKLLEIARICYRETPVTYRSMADALAAFEPTPIDRLREKLKEAGFEQCKSHQCTERFLGFSLHFEVDEGSRPDQYWRLKDEGAKP